MRTLVLATTNPGKVAEFRALLARHPDLAGITLATPRDLGLDLEPVEETGETFAQNARLKAAALTRATGLPALADDSGLCVDALGGEPGLHSARWAGPAVTDVERTALLLARLRDVPLAKRTARFVCAVTLALPDGQMFVQEAACEGVITNVPQGDNGFGYDPVFLIPSLGRTLAALTQDEKNTLSHRAQAVALLAPALRRIFPSGRMAPAH